MFRRRSILTGPKTPLDELLALDITWKFVGDPNAAGGVTLSGGGRVDNFNDLSGNDAHFDVSTTTELDKPTIGGAGQMQIIGANSFLENNKTTTYWDFLSSPDANSLILFLRIKDNDAGGSGVREWLSAGGALGSDVSWHHQRISNDVFRQLIYSSLGDTFFQSANDTIDRTDFWNFGFYLDSAIHLSSSSPSSVFIYEDNVQVGNLNTNKGADTNLSTTNSMLIGTDSDTGSSYTSDIEILKMAIGIGDLDTNKRTVIHDWLND